MIAILQHVRREKISIHAQIADFAANFAIAITFFFAILAVVAVVVNTFFWITPTVSLTAEARERRGKAEISLQRPVTIRLLRYTNRE